MKSDRMTTPLRVTDNEAALAAAARARLTAAQEAVHAVDHSRGHPAYCRKCGHLLGAPHDAETCALRVRILESVAREKVPLSREERVAIMACNIRERDIIEIRRYGQIQPLMSRYALT